MKNLKQLVELDVRTAMIEIVRTREQIAATAAPRKLQEEKLNTVSSDLIRCMLPGLSILFLCDIII